MIIDISQRGGAHHQPFSTAHLIKRVELIDNFFYQIEPQRTIF